MRRLAEALTLSIILLGAGIGVLLKRRASRRGRANVYENDSRWAQPGMSVTFRAELMPGRSASERTFRIVRLLLNGRVLLEGITGEHAENEFERIR
jgi:hypothetical protein